MFVPLQEENVTDRFVGKEKEFRSAQAGASLPGRLPVIQPAKGIL